MGEPGRPWWQKGKSAPMWQLGNSSGFSSYGFALGGYPGVIVDAGLFAIPRSQIGELRPSDARHGCANRAANPGLGIRNRLE